MKTLYIYRIPILALGILSLVTAMWGGLLRMGWNLPPLQPALFLGHGPLMVGGFLGTVIGLERALALGRPWAYMAPFFSAFAGLGFITGMPWQVSAVSLFLANLFFAIIATILTLRQVALYSLILELGAISWFTGNCLWLSGSPVFRIILWWQGFLILTIIGERLQLSKLLGLTARKKFIFLTGMALFILGMILSAWFPDNAARFSGTGLIIISLWLFLYDVATHTVKEQGLTRFVAVCLIAGYVWLAVGGGLFVVYGSVQAGPLYDALIHTIFLGFVMSMIFGHAPIIFPAILNKAIRFRHMFYGHLALLHLSLILRVWGDLEGNPSSRQWGGALNAVAIVLFLANTVSSVVVKKQGALA